MLGLELLFLTKVKAHTIWSVAPPMGTYKQDITFLLLLAPDYSDLPAGTWFPPATSPCQILIDWQHFPRETVEKLYISESS